MPHFPNPNAERRPPRLRFATGVFASVKADKKSLKANLQVISETGGRVSLEVKLQGGSLVEVHIQSSFGHILGLTEMLKPRPSKTDGVWIQPFRFVAFGDDDYENLRRLVNQGNSLAEFIRL